MIEISTTLNRSIKMTDNEIRDAAVEYVATRQADYAQFYTAPDCRIEPEDDIHQTHVQVWVAIPTKDLKND